MTQLVEMICLLGPARRAVIGGVVRRVVQSLALGIAMGAAIRLVVKIIAGEAIGVDSAVRTGIACAVSLGIQLFTGWLAARFSWLASYQAVAHMRLRLLQHLREVPVNALKRRSRGDIVALLSTDLQLIEDFLSVGMPRLVQALGIPLVVITAVAIHDPGLAAVIGAPIVAMVPVMSWASRKIADLADRRQRAQAQASARMIDVVTAMPALRVYSTRQRTMDWYQEAVDQFRAISVEMVHKLIVPTSITGLVLTLGIPLVTASSGWRLDSSPELLTLVGVVLVVVLSVYQPVQGLLATNEQWQLAQAALRRMQYVTSMAPLPELENPAKPPENYDVEFVGVGYSYPPQDDQRAVAALENVNLRAHAGEITAIVGPSGSGKSTVLSLISRFDDPSQGSVRIGGIDLRRIAASDRSDLVTVVFQEVHLFPGTIAENIAVARSGATQTDIENAARVACAHEFISALPDGYDTELGEDGAGLSGGQRQRLSVARAVLKDAPIVLLDEATSALDPVHEAAVHQGIQALCRGRTTIVVAHKLATIVAADQIVVLDNGKVCQAGTHTELLKDGGLYARLWAAATLAEDWSL